MRRKVYLACKSFVQTVNNGRQCCVRLHAAKRLTNEKFGGSFWSLGRVLDLGSVLSLQATVVLRLNQLSISECVETSKSAIIHCQVVGKIS